MIDFALRLHRELPGVVCWSPYSVAAALHITLRLASGETRAQLLEVLGDKGLPSVHPPDFAVADRVWAREGMNLPDPVRWFDDVDTAVKLINADVEETTRGLIPSLLSSLHPATTAVLVNALYLKVAWASKFTPVGPRPFRGAGSVESMELTGRLGYRCVPGWQVVVVPARHDVEAVVLLPDDDLGDAPVFGGVSLRGVRITMPLLDLTGELMMAGPLQRIGLTGIFRGGFVDPRLRIDEVIHKTVLRVDENGLEGAAATAMITRSLPPRYDDPIVVDVDRPFLFLVRHAVTGAVYFMAEVRRP